MPHIFTAHLCTVNVTIVLLVHKLQHVSWGRVQLFEIVIFSRFTISNVELNTFTWTVWPVNLDVLQTSSDEWSSSDQHLKRTPVTVRRRNCREVVIAIQALLHLHWNRRHLVQTAKRQAYVVTASLNSLWIPISKLAFGEGVIHSQITGYHIWITSAKTSTFFYE